MNSVGAFIGGLVTGGILGVAIMAFCEAAHEDEVIEPIEEKNNDKSYTYDTSKEEDACDIKTYTDTIIDRVEYVAQKVKEMEEHDIPWVEITEDQFNTMTNDKDIPFKELSYFEGDGIWVDDDNMFVAKSSTEVDSLLKGLDVNDVEDGSIFYYKDDNFAVRISKYDYGWSDLNYMPHGVEIDG